ncbi:MAG: hypothetical protein QXY05_03225, partial [Candidatus Anstonellales archaeon]
LFDDNKITQRNRTAKALALYFKLIDEKIQNEKVKEFLFGNAGVPILLYLYEPILAQIGKIPSRNDYEKYVDLIKKFFDTFNDERIKEIKITTTSEGSRKMVAKKIGRYIKAHYPNFWPNLEVFEITDDIIDMERKIGRLIRKKLSEIDANWTKNRVDANTYKYIKEKMERDHGNFEDYLDLGQERNIILTKKNFEEVFEDIFIRKEGFKSKGQLEEAFNHLSFIRAAGVHGSESRYLSISEEQIDIAVSYLKIFDRCLMPYIGGEEA